MNTDEIRALIELCRKSDCSGIKLDACITGINAEIRRYDGAVSKQITVWLDRNDPNSGKKLADAIEALR